LVLAQHAFVGNTYRDWLEIEALENISDGIGPCEHNIGKPVLNQCGHQGGNDLHRRTPAVAGKTSDFNDLFTGNAKTRLVPENLLDRDFGVGFEKQRPARGRAESNGRFQVALRAVQADQRRHARRSVNGIRKQ
jgi:hypothetical protein